MKILFVLPYFSDIFKKNHGGLEISIKHIIRKLKGKRNDVVGIASLEGNDRAFEIVDGVDVYRLPFSFRMHYFTKRDFHFNKRLYLKEIPRLPYLVFKVWRILRKENPDIVYIPCVSPAAAVLLFLSYLVKFKFVFALHGYSTQYLRYWDAMGINRAIFERLLKRADFVIAPSKSLIEDAIDWEPSIKEKSRVIPNGIDLDEFNVAHNHHQGYKEDDPFIRGLITRKPYIYFDYRFWPKKNYDKLIFAYRSLLDKGYVIDLVIFTSGDDNLRYEKLAELLKINKHLKIVDAEWGIDSCTLLKNAFIYLSLSEDLASDLMALEAISLGKRIIAKSKYNGGLKSNREIIFIHSDDECEIVSSFEQLLNQQGRDSALYPKAELKAAAYILAVSSLCPHKGVNTLIKAFKKISGEFPAVNLIIAGDGNKRRLWERFSEEIGLSNRVLFLGIVNRYEVVKLFRGCEFFVLPSWREPFGIVSLEAMAAGKAIVASCVDGIPEVVKNNVNGILVEPKNSQALAEAIKKLLKDKELRERLGNNGRKMAEDPRFSWDRITDEYVKIYEKVCGYESGDGSS